VSFALIIKLVPEVFNTGNAVAFERRSDCSVALSALARWITSQERHMERHSLADEFCKAHVLERALFQWRVHLRYQFRHAQHSKVARRFFLERRALAQWKSAVTSRKLDFRARELEFRVKTRHFIGKL
jgi:Sfi1 spindle body protein